MEALVDQAALFVYVSGAKEAQDPIANLEADVSSVFLFLMGLLEEEEADGQTDQNDDAADEVWQQIWELVENASSAEVRRIAANWIRKRATESSSNDASVKS